MTGVITLTTDFGLGDAYVAAMKGVILNINPKATMVDICHSIEPQNIAQAAFVISTVYRYFPQDTIHVVVVDPGVGSQRRAVILKTPYALFVAPDNGVLSYILEKASPIEKTVDLPIESALPPGFEAIDIKNQKFWHHPVSSTFHARDIFAPVAAHLSLGVPLGEFGPTITSLFASSVPKPQTSADGLIGHILHIDHFGNLITDVKEEDLPANKISLEVAGHRIEGLSASYIEGDELLAIPGSSGYLEIAAKNGSAASLLGAKVGDEVRIKKKFLQEG